MRTIVLVSLAALSWMITGCGDSTTFQEPCHATQLENGDVKITCPQRKDSIIPSGVSSTAEECTITDNGDSTSTLSCGEKAVTVGYDCADGYPGDIHAGTGGAGLFLLQYTGCTSIQGDLSVGIEGGYEGNQDGEPTSPAAWPSLLESITSVGGSVIVRYNDTDRVSFPKLTSVGGNFVLDTNYYLTSARVAPNLTKIGGSLSIMYNQNLTSLDGLSGIESIGHGINVEGNDALTSLQGFPSVNVVHGTLSISYNDSLESLAGLPAITTIDGGLFIYDTAFTSLQGLEALETIGGELSIYGNDALTSLEGLGNLTQIGTYDISQNPALQQCDINAFLDGLTVENMAESSTSNNAACE